jgi:hypothetical protein
MTDVHENREITRQLAVSVATALGEGWVVDTNAEYDGWRVVYIDGPDGLRLAVGLDWRNTDRMDVSGVYPPNPDRSASEGHRLKHHKIGMSRFREPDVIAKEIRRRLLPGFTEDLQALLDARQRDADNEAARQKAINTLLLCDVPGSSKTTDGLYFPGGSVRMNADGTTAHIEMYSVPTALTHRILKLIAKETTA